MTDKTKRIIEIAEACDGRMVYVWGDKPTVEHLDIMQFVDLILKEFCNDGRVQLPEVDDNPKHLLGRSGGDIDHDAEERPAQPDQGRDIKPVQLRRKRKSEEGKEVVEGV